MTRASFSQTDRINQGDIFKDVVFFESSDEISGIITINKIVFPLVIVLTQDCDLEGDYKIRQDALTEGHNTKLLSAIVAPLYNIEHFRLGNHLEKLGYNMERINSDKLRKIKKGRMRYAPSY